MANLAAYPESFDNGAWTQTNVTVLADQVAAPDGTTTADKITTDATGTSQNHRCTQSYTYATTTNYFFSVYLKKGNTQYVGIQVGDGGSTPRMNVDMDSETIVYNPFTNARVTSVGGGWVRLEGMFQRSGAGYFGVYTYPDALGTSGGPQFIGGGTEYFYAWGFQVEVAPSSPPYGQASAYTAVSGWVSSSSSATYAQFDTGGAWRIRQWEKTLESFTIKLEDNRGALKKKVPATLFDLATYPNILQEFVGEPIPIAYGYIYDAPAIPIDATIPKFLVAGHEITGFDSVRVLNPSTEQWDNIPFLATTEADGTFTLTSTDWDGSSPVAVNFRGKPTSTGSGEVMTNAADVVYDFLTVECNIPTAQVDLAGTFAASDAKVLIGTGNLGHEKCHKALSLYIDELEEATTIMEMINRTVGSYLLPDEDGVFQYVVFEPVPGDGLTLFDESNVFSFQEVTETAEKVSQVRGKFRYRKARDTHDSVVFEDASRQYHAGEPVAMTDEVEFPVYEERDANYVTQREVRMRGVGHKIYKMRVSHEGFLVAPTDFIKVELDRGSINAVFEVLERKISLPGMAVELTVGNLHGMRDETGFWVADSPTFPASLGGASCATWSSGWSDALKAWARQNVGYWMGDTNFADDADPDSFMASVWF